MKTLRKIAVILLVFSVLSGCAAYPAYGYGYGGRYGYQGAVPAYNSGYGYYNPPAYKDAETHLGNYAFHPGGVGAGAYERHMDTHYGPCWRVGRRGSHC